MSLLLKHFDTKLQKELNIEERIEHCLAKYLFPETFFAIGEVYKNLTVPEDLQKFSDFSLQFSSGERIYFASAPVREKLYPNPSDGAAYGSLLFTPCLNFNELSVSVLIVDDVTGENGGILPAEAAKRLVGDCFGRIDPTLAKSLTGSDDKPFQFRLGIKPQPASPLYRVGKGTLAPFPLESLSSTVQTDFKNNKLIKVKAGLDLILPTSSFKGRKGKETIPLGIHTLQIGLGVKSLAEYGTHSLGTQVLVNYPQGVIHDILPILKEKAQRLVALQSDIRSLAQYYVEKYEIRQQTHFIEDEEPWFESVTAIFKEDEESASDFLLYPLIKTDVENHSQLLEHPKIIQELSQFLRKEWLDVATGRAIKFLAGMAQPSLDLGLNQVCIPILPEGEEVIVSRSPLLNSNGVIILKNVHQKPLMKQKGVVYIHPETAAQYLQADFDGDRLMFEEARKYPILTREIKEAQKPENRYPEVVKRDKIPYRGSFEEIAVAVLDNKIGIIANQIQKAIALRWETVLLPEKKKRAYVQKMAQYYQSLLAKKEVSLPPTLRKQASLLGKYAKGTLSEGRTEQALQELRSLLRTVVGHLAQELQVATDGFKSAERPNELVLTYGTLLSSYRPVAWVRDKKQPLVYQTRSMESKNDSPIDLMIQQTNSLFEVSQLQPRPSIQFADLFHDVTFTAYQLYCAQEIHDIYQTYIKEAVAAKEGLAYEAGLQLELTVPAIQKTLTVTALEKFNPALIQFLSQQEKSDFVLTTHLSSGYRISLAVAWVNPEVLDSPPQVIGLVANDSLENADWQLGQKLNNAKISFIAGLHPNQVKVMFSKAKDFLERVREMTAQDQKNAQAAALWVETFKRADSFKKGTVAFATYPDEVRQRLETLQFTRLNVTGLHQPTNDYGEPERGKTLWCAIAIENNPDNPNYGKRIIVIEGQKFAPLAKESPSLPVGTFFQALIDNTSSASVVATTSRGNTIKITRVREYAYAEKIWEGEKVELTLDYRENKLVAITDGKVLGTLDKESRLKLQQYGLLRAGTQLGVALQSAPVTTAIVKILPQTVIYPWQYYAKQKELTATIAPIIANLLSLVGKNVHEGKQYKAVYDDKLNTLSLFIKEDHLPSMVAIYQEGTWLAMPAPILQENGTPSPFLTEEDVKHFEAIEPLIQHKLTKKELDI